MSEPIETPDDQVCECENESREHMEADERGRRPCTSPGCKCTNFTPAEPIDNDDQPNEDSIDPDSLIGIT